jgi:hypothetical protein
MTIGPGKLHGQASPRQADSRSFFVGPSVMNDRLADHFDHRPIALGVEADYVLVSGPALRGGVVSLAGRAHYYSNASLLGDTPPYYVTSIAAGIAYHPIGERRLDPYAGITVRSRHRAKSQSDSTTVDALLDAGARLRLSRRLFVQAGMSFGEVDAFGLWRVALMFKL